MRRRPRGLLRAGTSLARVFACRVHLGRDESMRKPLPAARSLAAIALLLLLPLCAQAGKITVDFDFSGSSVAILGGFINVPPDGVISSGSGQVEVGAAGIATPTGPAQAKLSNLTLAGTLNKSGFGVDITGAVGATQPGTAIGLISAGLGNLQFNPFVVNFTGFANCTNTGTGTGCTVLGLPTTFTGPKTFTITSLGVAGLASPGSAALNGTFTFTLAGFTAVLSLVGSEVGRTFIPEPGTFGLLGLGLAGLVVARRARR